MVTFYGVFTFLAIISGLFILWKVPLIPPGEDQRKINKKISIIVPARNEEQNLPILLQSLQKQTLKPFEILVVDDASEDQTVAVAKEYEARVVHFPKDETDWVGKAAACYHGAKAASGEWFLFLDADVFLSRNESLEEIATTFGARNQPSALSIQPYHVVKEGYENLSLVFNLLVLAGMNRFSILKEQLQPAGAFGPSLLIERQTYFEQGGHKRVRGSMMENIDLGNMLLNAGVPVDLYGGKSSLHFRMYPEGYHSLAEGWSKSFVSGSKATHPFILLGTSLWIAGAFVPLSFLLAVVVTGSCSWELILLALLGYLLYYVQLLRMTQAAGNFHRGVLFFYPVLFLYFVFLFAWSAIQTHVFKRVSWKGREINMKGEADGK